MVETWYCRNEIKNQTKRNISEYLKQALFLDDDDKKTENYDI